MKKLTPRSILLLGAAVAAAATCAWALGSTADYQPRPIPMGVSIGNSQSYPYIYAGTAGMRVYSLRNPSVKYILSNNHVLGAKGPTLCPSTAVPKQTVAIQPGNLDIGTYSITTFAMGTYSQLLGPYGVGLFAGAVPIRMSLAAGNVLDAAVAYTDAAHSGTEIYGLGEPTQAVGYAAPGMAVAKTGRTTGTTYGTVEAVNVTSLIDYGTGCGIARFVKQVAIGPGTFSAGGDSGSVILDAATNTPVALLFAGSASQTVANPIDKVYSAMGVFVDGPAAYNEFQLAAALDARRVDREMETLEEIQARNEDDILLLAGVLGIGIGLTEDGTAKAFVLYVQRGLSARALAALPEHIERIPVRVVETDSFRAR